MNRVFENNIELKTAEELEAAYYANYPGLKRYPYDLERLEGELCDCKGEGVFDLLPASDMGVIEGGKRYMQCRKCGRFSHL